MSSSQYQELSDEMKELEKRGESRTSDIDTRVGALENRIIDLAEAHELADREEGGETNEDVTRRLAELEASWNGWRRLLSVWNPSKVVCPACRPSTRIDGLHGDFRGAQAIHRTQ